MSQQLGFSRDLIVAQFERECSDNIGEKVIRHQILGVRNRYPEGTTIIETAPSSLDVTFSKVFDRKTRCFCVELTTSFSD